MPSQKVRTSRFFDFLTKNNLTICPKIDLALLDFNWVGKIY